VAAPEYVPIDYTADPRTYGSPPRRPEPWTADRPGDVIATGQPVGPMLGNQGPDLGYALKLVNAMSDQLVLAEGEHLDDVVAGGTAIAMRRAALFGRAPIIHDLTVAFSVWGFLDTAPDELVELRQPLFAGIANHHHWVERRRVVDLVPESVLRMSHTELARGGSDWKRLLDLGADA
jgi:hypothetical protein